MRPPPRPDWQDQAACRAAPPELFFPTKDTGAASRGENAKSWCARCPVIRACLYASIDGHDRDGIWGGAGDPTRQRLAKLTRGRTAASHEDHDPRTCGFCAAVDDHVDTVRRAFNQPPEQRPWEDRCSDPDCAACHAQPNHGTDASYLHAGCRRRCCDDAHRASRRQQQPDTAT